MAILHPLSTASTARYESLNNFYFGDGAKTVTIIDDGLWLRQEDETGNFILKANDIDAQKWIMDDVSVFFFDSNNTDIQPFAYCYFNIGIWFYCVFYDRLFKGIEFGSRNPIGARDMVGAYDYSIMRRDIINTIGRWIIISTLLNYC